jgi:hypothetical protein
VALRKNFKRSQSTERDDLARIFRTAPIDSDSGLPRREWLSACLLSASGLILSGFGLTSCRDIETDEGQGSFAGGKRLGNIDFVGEGRAPMDTALNAELDGRLFTDLSSLTSKDFVTPIPKFYIRTRASQLLDLNTLSSIQTGQTSHISLRDLIKNSKPQGLHLMECAGNSRGGHFGMIGVADWSGVPISTVLDRIQFGSRTNRVLISGFDTYAAPSINSIPGASWIFTQEQLRDSRAFLATKMNGEPLLRDHGAPVRLVVPGWYGCVCIKWVNEIVAVDSAAYATSQMREYAGRTHQSGVPALANEYDPAIIEPAAMPIRVEKWQVKNQIKYRVVGILWGGTEPVRRLEIQFNPDSDFLPVDEIENSAENSWRFWIHAWTPREQGIHQIRLRVVEPKVRTRRLDMSYYVRTVDVLEV